MTADEHAELDLARAAKDVMRRQGWGVLFLDDKWRLTDPTGRAPFELREFKRSDDCPFILLVAADQWLQEREGK